MDKNESFVCHGIDENGDSTHPKVYFKRELDGRAVCPYCYTVFDKDNFIEDSLTNNMEDKHYRMYGDLRDKNNDSS